MVKLAVFASGSGTNFENIVNRINDGTIKNAAVALLVVVRNTQRPSREQSVRYSMGLCKSKGIPFQSGV